MSRENTFKQSIDELKRRISWSKSEVRKGDKSRVSYNTVYRSNTVAAQNIGERNSVQRASATQVAPIRQTSDDPRPPPEDSAGSPEEGS